MTEDERPWVGANKIMLACGFRTSLMRDSQVWAAKHRKCPACKANPFTPCLNMVDIKNKGRDKARVTKWPHKERVDWNKLERALRERGYAE